MFAGHSYAVEKSLKAQHQRPEGKLLEQAMAGPPKITGRQLAKRVGLSEGRIRQIVSGYRTEAGVVLEIVAPADTLARIAEELRLSPDALAAAGRDDVAEQMRAAPRVGVTEEGDLWLSDNSEEVALLQEWLTGDDPANTTPPAAALALWGVDDLLDAAKRKHSDEMRLLNFMVLLGRNARTGGDGDAEEPRGSAPTKPPHVSDEDWTELQRLDAIERSEARQDGSQDGDDADDSPVNDSTA